MSTPHKWVKTLWDTKKKWELKRTLLVLLETQLPQQGLMTFDGDMHDPKDEAAHLLAQVCLQLVKDHPQYAIQQWSKSFGICRREDLDKFASKETVDKTMSDGVLITNQNAGMIKG